jgi:hypothetical protein
MTLLFMALILFFPFGCSPVDQAPPEPVNEEPDPVDEPEIEEAEPELPVTVTTYYWPWISHGQLELSSGEIIIGPDLFESDLGFIGEFTAETLYDGRLIWRVESTDLFTVEWLLLIFDVEFFDQSEVEETYTFNFLIEDLQPEPGEEGLQEFEVDLSERQQDFVVTIKRVVLGKEVESAYASDPVNYIALDLEMSVVVNQE